MVARILGRRRTCKQAVRFFGGFTLSLILVSLGGSFDVVLFLQQYRLYKAFSCTVSCPI